MSSLSLRLPDSLHDKIRELAERENISINQFIAMAVAEKTAALLTVDYLTERAERADDKLLDRLLKRVPDVPPIPGDELSETPPSGGKRPGRRAAEPRRSAPHRAKR
jgi:predicted transcriptional regulator